jgi:hypothetical protein
MILTLSADRMLRHPRRTLRSAASALFAAVLPGACTPSVPHPTRWSLLSSAREGAIATLFALLAASLLFPARVLGQQWKCVAPSDCGPLIPNGGTVSFALRIEHSPALMGADLPVTIKMTDGVLYIGGDRLAPSENGLIQTRTDARGMLSGYVQGAKNGQEIVLDAEVRPKQFVTQTLKVGTPIVLSSADPGSVRYAGTQSWDVSVYADDLDAETCRRSVVRFTPRGGAGSVSADSAYGEFQTQGGVCMYSTDWRLGNEVGRQVLLARAGSAPPLEVTAIARRKPALRMGLGMALRRGGISTVENSRAGETIRVRRLTPEGYIEYDSVPVGKSVTTSPGWQPEAIPLILIDGPAPFLLRHTGVRVSVGASPINVRRDFFVGLGVQQLRYGVQAEDNGFDVQVGALMSRPKRLRNSDLCERDLQAERPKAELDVSCASRESFRFDGIIATVSTDAQSLIGAIGKMLGLP